MVSTRPIPNDYLRVSDAERQEVADILKRHATDGRLDAAEFEARLDRTLNAKTRADLSGLLDDLPDPDAARTNVTYGPGSHGHAPYGADPWGGPYGGPYGGGLGRRRRGTPSAGYRSDPYAPRPPTRTVVSTLLTVFLVVFAFFATLSAISHVARFHFLWLFVAIAAVLLWRRGHGHGSRRWRA